jgi:hypothetical protein
VSRLGRVLGALGVGLGGLAIGLAVDPSLAVRLGLVDLLTSVRNGYLLVAGLGVVAVIYGLVVWLSWSVTGVEEASPPAVEEATGGEVPGSELDAALPELAGRRGRAARPVEHRDWIRDRLQADAAITVARVRNCSRSDAEDRIESGSWTDDRYASDFLGGPDAPGPRLHQRLWNGVRRRNAFSVRVRRTIDALDRLEGSE